MDALSDLFKLIKLQVSIYHNATVCGNWIISENNGNRCSIHVVTSGSCRLEVPGLLSTTIERGDVVIFPKEICHTMTPSQTLCGPQEHIPQGQLAEPSGTGLLCAHIDFLHNCTSSLLKTLPPVFITPVAFRDSSQSIVLMNMIYQESIEQRVAAQAISNKITELLFCLALREYLLSANLTSGITALYSHPRLSKAINAIHRSPENEWNLDSLAKESNLSRTAFATTFKIISGLTPYEYLTWWRMQLAITYLKDGINVSEVSLRVGYNSESSFLRAFKRIFGVGAGKIKQGIECPALLPTINQ
jgi:AraC family transcriptional regulator, activator of mtrCDE